MPFDLEQNTETEPPWKTAPPADVAVHGRMSGEGMNDLQKHAGNQTWGLMPATIIGVILWESENFHGCNGLGFDSKWQQEHMKLYYLNSILFGPE